MVTARSIFVGVTLGACAAGAVIAAPKASPSASGQKPDSAVRKLIQNCDAHKFETVVKTVVDGEPRQSKVRLCGNEGQSDAEWIGTLKDAIAKLGANKDMAPAVREQIVTAIRAEIARIETGAGPAAKEGEKEAAAIDLPLRPRPQPQASVRSEYSSLPPLPTTSPPPPHVIGRVAVAAGKTSGGTSAKSSEAAIPLLGPAVAAPKLSFACYTPGDIGGDAPCSTFNRDTILTVRAGEDVRRGLEIRFARNGEERATVELAQLRKGRSMRLALPSGVCQGVGDGRLDLKLVEGGYVINSDGPYPLRC